MKLGVISDLHIDHNDSYDFNTILNRPDLDCLIIAGDITSDREEMLELAEFLNKSNNLSLIVLGNHDYYNNTRIEDTKFFYETNFAKFDKVKLLYNSGIQLGKYKICGGTGWYPGSYNHNTNFPDFRHISLFESNRQINYEKTYRFLYANQGPNTIFVTHHIPYDFLLERELLDDERIRFYLMKYHQVLECKMWIYGHTHMQKDVEINGIRYIHNPFGYMHEGLENNIKEFILD